MKNNNYEKVLGDIACFIANKCDLTPSEAVGLIMNDDRTEAVVGKITTSASDLDLCSLANIYLDDAL